MKRHRLVLALAVLGALAACGGGLLAVLPYVAAIGGTWSGGVQDGDSWRQAVPTQTLNFLEPAFPDDLYLAENAEVQAVLTGLASNCGGADDTPTLTARFEGGERFTLTRPNATAPCLSGVLINEITLQVATGGSGSLFRNLRPFDPIFSEGVWVNIDRTDQKLRFLADRATVNGVTTQSGCEYVGSTRTGTFVATYRLGDNEKGTLPVIDSIVVSRTGGTETFTQGKMRGISGIEMLSGPSTLSLQRKKETLSC